MNDIKKGKLTATYVGCIPWGYKLNVPTCNVYHEYYVRFPVATFHHADSICFKAGVTWENVDLNHLIELHQLWQIECKSMQTEVNTTQ